MIKANLLTTFETFNDKMIISTSKEDKKILLWDENTMSVIYSYEDSNMKSFISKEKLFVIGKELYSEYILALQENKSLISIWKTNSSECAIKCSPIDERMTSVDISNNDKLIFIATETGVLFIYELFSGNLLSSVQIASSSIQAVKSCFRDGGIILILSDDYIKLFSIENLIQLGNTSDDNQFIAEIPNYDSLNNVLYILELNLLIFFSTNKNKIVISEFPSMKVLKNVYIQNNYNITKINHDYNILYVTFDSGNIFLLDIKEIIFNNEESDGNTIVTYVANENIFPILQTESKISTVCITSKNILTGLEDGKIIAWNKFNHKKENVFSIHKGGITNIVQINRPISQYGLNFNTNIEETIVKSLKKPSIGYNFNLQVKNSIKNENFVDNYLDDFLDGASTSVYNQKNSKKLYAGNEKLNGTLSDGAGAGLNKGNKIISKNNLNLEDNNFLRTKLNEVLNILNNK